MFKKSERRNRRGFTLAEVLTVVAIIGILLAVAIPNVISYYRSLKLTELDDSAKTIFMAAQSRLTAMTAAGQDLYKEFGPTKSVPTSGASTVMVTPVSDKPKLDTLVLGGSIESQLHDNNYVVEIDPKTGAVYAVWYWEKDGEFNYTTDAYTGNKLPERDWRLDKMVGYYGGPQIDRLDLEQTNFPSLQLTNAEELRLEITVPGKTGSGTQPEIYATVTLSDGGGKCVIIKEAQLKYYTGTDNINKGVIVLDTLKNTGYDTDLSNPFTIDPKGKQFKNWTDLDTSDGNYTITPGADFDIEVKVEAVDATGGDKHYLPQYIYWTDVNSLFADVTGDTAHIAYGRHLQNLDTATSGVTSSITKAEQTRSIDFNDSTSVKGVYSWAETYGTRQFTAIYNADLTFYDGHSLPIRNLDAVKNPGTFQTNNAVVAGLFGYIKGDSASHATLQYITLIDSLINANPVDSDVHNVGVLAGIAENTEIVNCRVYIENPAYLTTSPTPMVVGNSRVGGLVGAAYGYVKVSDSFASTVAQSNASRYGIGGLVGEEHTSGSTLIIDESYAACYLIGGQHVGGLVGDCEGGTSVTISNSYAAGIIAKISNNGVAAGLIADVSTTATLGVNNSYAAVRYGEDVLSATGVVFYGVAPGVVSAPSSHVYYVKQTGVNYVTDSGEAVSMSKLKDLVGKSPFNGTDWYDPGTGTKVNPQGLTVPYNMIDGIKLNDPYPYPMLASSITAVGGDKLPMPHYGDWLENSYATSFYWEKEKDSAGVDKYHIYLVMSDGTTQYIADNLCTEHHLNPTTRTDVEAWGYGLIGIDAGSLTRYTGTDGSSIISELTTFAEKKDSYGTANSITDEALEDIKALLSDTNNVILLEGSKSDDFETIKTKVGYIEMNLGFAAAIDVTNTVPNPTTPTPTNMGKDADNAYQIRTIQQLKNAATTDDGATTGKHFKQGHDIVFGSGDSYNAAWFNGAFNGGFYRILNATGPIFGVLSGDVSLQNIIVYAPMGNMTIEGDAGLAEASMADNAIIENCVVAGYNITSSNYVGGLVGHVTYGSLTITKSEAVNTLSYTGSSSTRGYVGGLVGYVEGDYSSVTITNCYAGGSITAATRAGGLVGRSTGTTRYNDDVYSYVDMSDPALTASTYYGIGPGTVNGTAKYWQDGLKDKSVTSITGVTAVSLADLKAPAGSEAQQTYKPGADMTEGLTNTHDTENYPFTPVAKGPRTNTSTDTDTVLVHYGSWPPDEPAAQSFGYYDDGGGSVGFYGYIVDPATSAQTFANSLTAGTPGSGNCATVDGYCIPVERVGGASTTAPAAPTVDGITCTVDPTPVATDVAVDTGTKRYDLYKINGLEGVGATNYYNKITVGSTEYWFNPFFACEVLKADGTMPTEPAAKEDTDSLTPSSAPPTSATPLPNYEGRVIIRTARQLMNLVVQTGDKYNSTNQVAQNRDYVQLLDIDYDKYTGTDLKVGKTGMPKQTPASLNIDGSYNGNNFLIRNLYIGDGTSKLGTGLFGDTKGTLSNIRLVNVSVISTENDKKNLTGALAGNIEGDSVSILNCGVYVDNDNKPTSADPTKSAYDLFTIKGEDRGVGGLVGKINASSGNLEVKDCFAAVKVEGDNERVGGLIGHLSADNVDGTLTNCYSGGHTVNGNYDGNDVNVIGLKQVGGLIGCITGHASNRHTVTLSNVNYSTCSVQLTSGSNSDKERIGLLVGEVTDAAEIVIDTTSIIYATGVAYDDKGSVATKLYDESDYLTTPTATPTTPAANLADILAVTNNETGVNAENTKYDSTLGASYPYLTASGAEHHGDWPELQEAVFYWEQEGTGTGVATSSDHSGYHFYAKGLLNGQEVTLDTLCKDGTHNISDYGYGLYGLTGPTGAMDATTKDFGDKFASMFGGTNVSTFSDVTASTSYSIPSSADNSKHYEVNLGAGKAIDLVNGSVPSATPAAPTNMGMDADNAYEVRTARQLDNIEGTSTSPNTAYYKQTRDIDGDGYTYTSNEHFAGHFDGGGYVIKDLDIKNDGLFGSIEINGGTVEFKNIILYSEKGQTITNSSPQGKVGGIVGEITGNSGGTVTITNCAVAGYKIECTNADNAGGLIGKLEVGTGNFTMEINKCEAVNSMSGADDNGGLVGGVICSGGSLLMTVKNSYAGGEIVGNGSVSGLVGAAPSADVSYENVYSYVDMTDNTSGVSFYVIGPNGTGGTYTNCRYLNKLPTGETKTETDTNIVEGLTDCMKDASTSTGYIEGFGTAVNTYPSGTSSGPYPYPAVVTDEEGKFVHYGDWPTA